jgi:hypothetical protein
MTRTPRGKVVWFTIEDLIKLKIFDFSRTKYLILDSEQGDVLRVLCVEYMKKHKYVFFEEIPWEIRISELGQAEIGIQYRHID